MAVYFDASILCGLSADLTSPELVRLSEAAVKYEVGRFVPEVAKREWIFFHQEMARRKHDEMHSAARLLGRYLGRDFKVEAVEQKELLKGVRQTQVSRFDAAGLIEVPTPDVDVKALTEMAVRRMKPFAEGDKGFRDTLIALTIGGHAAQYDGHSILVVSKDEVFGLPEVHRRWWSGVTTVVVRTLEQAVSQLEAAMDEVWKRYLDQEAEDIKKFLVSKQSKIFERLKEVEVSESFIRDGGVFSPLKAYYGSLQRVRQIRPLEITSVSRGHVGGPYGKENGRVPVTFSVKVAFDITANNWSFANLLSSGPRIRLGDATVTARPSDAPAELVEQDLSLEREISIEGWVTQNAAGKYEDLVIEKIQAW